MPTKRFCRLLDAAIKDEKKADSEYRRLKAVAPSVPTGAKAVIGAIRRQERKHHKALKHLKRLECQ